MRALLLLLGLALASTAAAAPLVVVPGGGSDHYGLASQGSVDEAEAWYPWHRVCAFAVTSFRVTLELLHAGPDDLLLLEVPNAGVATVRVGQPATLEGVQNDSCVDFTVRGVRVEGQALYRVLSVG